MTMTETRPSDAWGQDAGIITITPEDAKDILDRAAGYNFRGLRAHHARQLAHEMTAGNWRVNGEAIKFDEQGVLIDGQHRLKACVLSGVPLVTWAIYGVPRDVDMDMGVRRATHDLLKANGETDSRTLGSSLAALLMIESGMASIGKGSVSYSHQVLACLERHPGIREFVSRRDGFGIFDRPTMFPALWYCFASADAHKAELFMVQLRDGVNVQQGSAVLMLRNLLLKMRLSSRKLDQQTALAVCVKAWNLYLQGRVVRSLSWKPNEPFPRVIGCRAFGEEYLRKARELTVRSRRDSDG